MLTVQSSLVFRHGATAQALVLARVERLIGHPRLDLAPTNCALDQADWDCFQPLRLPSTKRAFFEFSLCLSRACLGQMFVYIYKWLKIAVFSYLALMSSAPKYMQVAENCAQAECWLVAVLSEGSAALAVTLCHLYSGPALSEF